MTLRDPTLRAAYALVSQDRREKRAARPKRVQPVADGQRQPRKHDKPYLQFIRRQACAARALGLCEGPVEAAHVRYSVPGRRNPGLQRKPDDRLTLPLCASHHRLGPQAQHSMGEAKFWSLVGVDPAILMQELSWQYDTLAKVKQ